MSGPVITIPTQPDKRKRRILVIDDDVLYGKTVRTLLVRQGFEVIIALDGEEGLRVAARKNFDLIVLDVRMPRMNGYSVCSMIREFSDVPILMVTVMFEEDDVVMGLEVGADDYLAKPFSERVFLARIGALLRRRSGTVRHGSHDFSHLSFGDLRLEDANQRAIFHDCDLGLSPTEYRLLRFLAVNHERTVSPDEILTRVWGAMEPRSVATLQSTLNRLRQKLEQDPEHPSRIITRKGFGYRFIP